MGQYQIFARSNPEDTRECSSCEIKEIADWLGATYEEDKGKTKIVIDKGPNKRLKLIILKVLPNILHIFAARSGNAYDDIPATLSDINKFIFQKLEFEDRDREEEIRQMIFRNKKGAEVIIDDSGFISFSG